MVYKTRFNSLYHERPISMVCNGVSVPPNKNPLPQRNNWHWPILNVSNTHLILKLSIPLELEMEGVNMQI